MNNQFFSGVLPSPLDKRDYKISRCMDMPVGGADTVVPRNFECWIPDRYYNQGQTASCTAFAMATIFSCIWHKLTGEDRDFSTGFIYGNNLGDHYNGYGACMRDVAKTVTKYGDILASVGNDNSEKPEAFEWFEKTYPKFKDYSKLLVKEYVRIWDFADARAFMYKYQIPLFVSMKMRNITPFASDPDGLHAVVAYKYTFNFGLDCKNSWGEYNCPKITNKRFDKFEEVWGIVPNEKITFSDVTNDMWCADAINKQAQKGVLQGFPDGTFKPDEPITRGQMAVLLERLDRANEEKFEKNL